MSGPVQWTAQGIVPAIGALPVVGDDDDDDSLPAPANRRQPPPKPQNIVALAKARLKEAKAELKRLRAVQKEVAELERLIAAAKAKPRAVVRELKRSAG